MQRLALVLILLVGVFVMPGPVAASELVDDGNGGQVELQPLVFPVDGPHRYSDTWGACRGADCERSHLGVDIMADKMVPVVAAAAGVVTHVNWSWTAEGIDPARCCTLQIRHDSGWYSRYIHLNNDTPGTDDGLGWGIAAGLVPGVRVEAGQLIGWVGDSGNAEWTGPHLHFELQTPDRMNVNPYPHVLAAGTVASGRFLDDDASVHEANIELIAELGITRGCNPPANDRFCPGGLLTRGQVSAMLRRSLGLPATSTDHFSDDGDSIFEDDINALAEAGVAFGCTETEFCANDPLLREEMARFLVRAFEYAPSEVDAFGDDDGSAFEADINALAAAGVTKGCNPPANDRYCGSDTLTRAQFATFVVRAMYGPDN
jgi:hypothetical protein